MLQKRVQTWARWPRSPRLPRLRTKSGASFAFPHQAQPVPQQSPRKRSPQDRKCPEKAAFTQLGGRCACRRRIPLSAMANCLWKLDLGAGEEIRTLDPNLGKVVLYH